jgi:hypothetical protein
MLLGFVGEHVLMARSNSLPTLATRKPGSYSTIARVLLGATAIVGVAWVANQWPMDLITVVLLGVAIAMMLVMSLFEVRFTW